MKKFWIYTCMLFAGMLASCEDVDKLEDDIQALEDRVTALEEKVKPINDNVKALVEIYKAGVITSIEEKADGHYTLTLSNGKTVELAKWVEGFGSVPMVGVSSAGNWQVSYDRGATWKDVLQDGEPVPAVSDSGRAPQFRVDANGYWEVDADGDGSFEQVKDVNGQPVKAVYDPEGAVQVFESVTPKGDLLEIVLKNGEKLNIPIVPDFYCYFDEAIQGEQAVKPGETKQFKVHLKGADHTVVTAPMGWKAVLGVANEQFVATLTLTAPQGNVQPAVRATADNMRDVSILAFKGAFATVTKMQVNAIDVEIGGGTEMPEEQDKTSLTIPMPAGAVENIGKYASTNQVVNPGWFQREDAAVTTLTVNQEGISLKVGATKGAWNNSSVGYFAKETFMNGVYLLTFKVKADAVSSVGIGIRTAGDDKGFRMLKPDGKSNFQRNVTTPKVEEAGKWVEISQYFDLGYASAAMTSNADNYTKQEMATAPEDLTGLSCYFYNNQPNTTIVIKDIQLNLVP